MDDLHTTGLRTESARAGFAVSTAPQPRLLGVAGVVPPHVLSQEAIQQAAGAVFGPRLRDFARLAPVYANAGIATRYISRPLDWYLSDRSWAEKNAAYLETALELLERATRICLERTGVTAHEIDAVVVVSSTGIATPSLDALLMERLELRPETRRLPIFGLGCAGGVLGLSRAADWARALPGATILLLVVELCSLTIRQGDLTATNIVATALFGDGAAAVLIRSDGPEPAIADPGSPGGPAAGTRLGPAGEHTWPGTRSVMGWRVENDGLGVVFSQDIPALVRARLRPALEGFLGRHSLTLADFAGLICHPGGVKVLTALEETLAPLHDGLDDAWAILRAYGNMSAVTVLFVLERRLAAGARGRHLMTAFGPGFTGAFQVIEL